MNNDGRFIIDETWEKLPSYECGCGRQATPYYYEDDNVQKLVYGCQCTGWIGHEWEKKSTKAPMKGES